MSNNKSNNKMAIAKPGQRAKEVPLNVSTPKGATELKHFSNACSDDCPCLCPQRVFLHISYLYSIKLLLTIFSITLFFLPDFYNSSQFLSSKKNAWTLSSRILTYGYFFFLFFSLIIKNTLLIIIIIIIIIVITAAKYYYY